jgi:hypothetical protein
MSRFLNSCTHINLLFHETPTYAIYQEMSFIRIDIMGSKLLNVYTR